MTKVWQTGDIITATDMNRLENRDEGYLIVNAIEETDHIRLDKTYAEIKNSLISGAPVFLIMTTDHSIECNIINSVFNDPYTVSANYQNYEAETENDYPSLDTSNPK